mgnify:FL=1
MKLFYAMNALVYRDFPYFVTTLKTGKYFFLCVNFIQEKQFNQLKYFTTHSNNEFDCY